MKENHSPYRLSITEPDSSWMGEALCAGLDSDIFFPQRDGKSIVGGNGMYKRAKRVCEKCPVKKECLDYAFHFNMVEFGMFGGMTPIARKRQFIRIRKLLRALQEHTEKQS